MQTVYLAGIIDRSNISHSCKWRDKAKDELAKHFFDTRSPLRGKDLTKPSTFEPNEIVDRDLWDILRSDIVLANISMDENTKKISLGTPCEIMFAYEHNIPVVLVSNVEQVRNHFWMKRLCTKIFPDLDSAVKFIVEWFGQETE